MDNPQVQFEPATPILRVTDFEASVRYYVEVLGFGLDWRDGAFGSVRRGETSIMLCEGSQGKPGTWMYIGVTNVDALHEELRSRGARIRHAPMNFPWGSRELHIFDLDGHVLRLGSGFQRGEPLGRWLDEHGVWWQAHEDGSWTRIEVTAAE